jgi:transcription elongation factor Elf1
MPSDLEIEVNREMIRDLIRQQFFCKICNRALHANDTVSITLSGIERASCGQCYDNSKTQPRFLSMLPALTIVDGRTL